LNAEISGRKKNLNAEISGLQEPENRPENGMALA